MNISVNTRTLRNVANKSKSSKIFRNERAVNLLDNNFHLFAFRFGGFISEPESFLNDVKRTSFHFRVDSSQVLADDAERYELHAAHKQHSHKQRCPTASQVLI